MGVGGWDILAPLPSIMIRSPGDSAVVRQWFDVVIRFEGLRCDASLVKTLGLSLSLITSFLKHIYIAAVEICIHKM